MEFTDIPIIKENIIEPIASMAAILEALNKTDPNLALALHELIVRTLDKAIDKKPNRDKHV